VPFFICFDPSPKKIQKPLQPQQYFEGQLQRWEGVAQNKQQQISRLSLLRLFVFILTIVLVISLATSAAPAIAVWLAGIAGFALFGWLLRMFRKGKHAHALAQALIQINQKELRLRKADFEGAQPFSPPLHKHPYASDLDIFGRFSVFSLLNRCTTDTGRETLSNWLLQPSTTDRIRERQLAVKELKEKADFRQQFEAAGAVFSHPETNTPLLLEWLKSPQIPSKKRRFFTVLLSIMPFFSISAVALYLSHGNNPLYVLPALLLMFLNYQLIKAQHVHTDDLLTKTYYNLNLLRSFKAMIGLLERNQFEAPLLTSLNRHFLHQGFKATEQISQLENILGWMQPRGSKALGIGGNVFYWIFNLLFLIDFIWLLRADNWKRRNQHDIGQWFRALGEWEALNSLAGFAFAHPNFAFPEVSERPYQFKAKQLGHPLLAERQRVCNDFSMEGKGSLVMITGSNMAGKSTFLRSVGVNMVLALAGSAVCAEQMEVSNMGLFTSMRTQDNLKESLSGFYAELDRLKQLLELLRADTPILFMLDELLKGTNSEDRQRGAVALVKQISQLKAFGIVSTHDLAMSRLAADYLPIRDYSFNSSIEQGEIHFDYRLTPGICKGFNASELMKRIGIDVDGLGKA